MFFIESLANTILFLAKILCNSDKEITAREMELWLEHVGPDIEPMLIPFHFLAFMKAIREEGLSDTPDHKAWEFMFGKQLPQ